MRSCNFCRSSNERRKKDRDPRFIFSPASIMKIVSWSLDAMHGWFDRSMVNGLESLAIRKREKKKFPSNGKFLAELTSG